MSIRNIGAITRTDLGKFAAKDSVVKMDYKILDVSPVFHQVICRCNMIFMIDGIGRAFYSKYIHAQRGSWAAFDYSILSVLCSAVLQRTVSEQKTVYIWYLNRYTARNMNWERSGSRFQLDLGSRF